MVTILFAFIISIQGNSSGQSLSDWKEFSPPGGGFSVLLPSKPKERIDKATVENIEFDYFTFESSAGLQKCAVSYHDFPLPLNETGLIEDVFRIAKKHLSAGKLLGETHISIDGHPGREYRYRLNSPSGDAFIVRVYIIGQRVYQLDYQTPRKEENLSKANQFFDSFKLVKDR